VALVVQAVLTEQVALVEQVVPAVVVLDLEKEALAEKGEHLVRTAHLAQMVLLVQMALEPVDVVARLQDDDGREVQRIQPCLHQLRVPDQHVDATVDPSRTQSSRRDVSSEACSTATLRPACSSNRLSRLVVSRVPLCTV
jgi:hypothetical protein